MDHQMQKARDIGLEALGARGLAGRGLGVGGQMGPLFKGLGMIKQRIPAAPHIVAWRKVSRSKACGRVVLALEFAKLGCLEMMLEDH
jgi:hypothetical protein